jgi:hypothetical protein
MKNTFLIIAAFENDKAVAVSYTSPENRCQFTKLKRLHPASTIYCIEELSNVEQIHAVKLVRRYRLFYQLLQYRNKSKHPTTSYIESRRKIFVDLNPLVVPYKIDMETLDPAVYTDTGRLRKIFDKRPRVGHKMATFCTHHVPGDVNGHWDYANNCLTL